MKKKEEKKELRWQKSIENIFVTYLIFKKSLALAS